MDKSTKLFRKKSCGIKKRHKDIAKAKEAVAHIKKLRGYRLRIYSCEFCKGFHLTSKRDFQK